MPAFLPLFQRESRSAPVAGSTADRSFLLMPLGEANCRIKLAQLVANPGSGKSAALEQAFAALENRSVPCRWLSLERGIGGSAARFAAALGKAIGGEASEPSTEAGLLARMGRLAASAPRTGIFLDGYEAVIAPEAHRLMERLLAEAPGNLFFVIASRSPLPLRLSSLRMSGRLLSIPAGTLHLSAEESIRCFAAMTGRTMSAQTASALIARTEGWAAGLRLAFLAAAEMPDPEHFLQGFSGKDRDVADYFAQAGFDDLDPQTGDALLRLSFLHRFNASLCKAVTGVEDGACLIERLVHDGLFVMELDRERCWYRFTALFAEFLQSRLLAHDPDAARSARRKAARWWRAHGFLREAIDYALLAEEYDLAASCLQDVSADTLQAKGRHDLILRWLERLPQDVLERWPALRASHAISLIFTRDHREVHSELAWLDTHCRMLENTQPPPKPNEMTVMRSTHASLLCLVTGISDDTLRSSQLSADWLRRWPDEPMFMTGAMNVTLSIACQSIFEYERALRAAEEARIAFEKCGAFYGLAWVYLSSALAHLAMGAIDLAHEDLRRGCEETAAKVGANSYAHTMLSLLLAEICYERNDLESARAALRRGMIHVDVHGIVETSAAGYVTQARLHFLDGELDTALAVLKQGEAACSRFSSKRLSLALRGERIALLLRAGRSDEAMALAGQTGFLNPSGRVPGIDAREITREIPRTARARLYLATGQPEQAIAILNGLIERAMRTGRRRRLIELLLLRACAFSDAGKEAQALRTLDQALAACEGQGFIRVFLDQGPTLIARIADMIGRRSVDVPGEPDRRSHLSLLADALSTHGGMPHTGPVRGEGDITLLEAPTKREIELLNLVAAGLSNREISAALFISEQTVKWHLRNLFVKLGVHNRTAALARARRLKLLRENR